MFVLKQLLQVPLVLFHLELQQCESGWRQSLLQRTRKGSGSSRGVGSGSKEQGLTAGQGGCCSVPNVHSSAFPSSSDALLPPH